MQQTWTLEHLFAATSTKALGKYQKPSGIWKTAIG